MADMKEAVQTTASPLEDFATARGLPVGAARKFIRIAGDDEEYPGWLAFDYPNVTGKWTTRYRNPDPSSNQRWRSRKGGDTHLYNPTLAGPDVPEVWLCEGETDTLTLVSLGLRAVGLPGTQTAERFKKSWKTLYEGAFVVVAFDNDAAGIEAGDKLQRAFWPNSDRLKMPEGMDVNEWHVSDPDGLFAAIGELRGRNGLA